MREKPDKQNYGPKKGLADKPFAVVPQWVLEDNSLKPGERVLYATLCSYANKKGACVRSARSIARKEGVTVRTIRIWMSKLETAGLVTKQPRPGQANLIRVIRHRDEISKAREKNLSVILKRKHQFETKKRDLRPSSADKPVIAEGKHTSPPPESPCTPTGVNASSPKQESKQNLFQEADRTSENLDLAHSIAGTQMAKRYSWRTLGQLHENGKLEAAIDLHIADKLTPEFIEMSLRSSSKAYSLENSAMSHPGNKK